jgi:hypothetical protein
MIDRRTFAIGAVLLSMLAAGLTAYEVYGEARHHRVLVGAWAAGLAAISWWAVARPAPQGGGRSFVAGAGAVLGLGAIGVAAGLLVVSSAYGRWRDTAMASVDRIEDLATRERVRAYAESELTIGFYLFDDVGVPVAKWPTLAVLPIAVLVGVIGFRERREPSDDD